MNKSVYLKALIKTGKVLLILAALILVCVFLVYCYTLIGGWLALPVFVIALYIFILKIETGEFD